ncbi:MAG: tRNA (N6-isopentenyl adenosine(37)-C2)-methylthiotransferase MiaB [Clostridia bacterium]
MKKYFIHTYGCQMNVHESEKIAGILESKDYKATTLSEEADIIVFNTCCIRETAEAKILGHIGEVKSLKRANTELIVVVCGCMTQQDGVAKRLKSKFPHVDIILGTNNIHLLSEKIDSVKLKKDLVDIRNEDTLIEDTPIYRTSGTNAWVNIIYGCNNFCTYCIVPYVRGRERSRNKDTIVAEVKQLLKDGYKEITLLGQNVNSYGKDLTPKVTFAQLLDEVGQIPGKHRIRFLTSHPKDLTHDVIETIKKYDSICKFIHLPVQSGSDKMLKTMNRHYNRSDYLAHIEDIKKTLGENVGISSDVMIGFAGETEEDFLETLSLMEQVRYTILYSFVYSRRKGTPGYLMENQIDSLTKRDRITRLQALQNKITNEMSETYINKVFEVLVEDTNNKYKNVYCGRTDNGRLVNIPSDKDLIGQFVNVQIEKHQSATLWGKLVD